MTSIRLWIQTYIAAILLILALFIGALSFYASWKIRRLEAQIVTLKADNAHNIEVARICSQSVDDLQTAADARDREFGPAIAAAEAAGVARGKKAAALLSKPATVPGNDCRSADDRARSWMLERGK